MNEAINQIKEQMLIQDNRSTSYPIFIIVEDRKIWGYSDHDDYDGKERKENVDLDDLCLTCRNLYEENGEFPEDDDCEEYQCGDSFYYYKIEKDVPKLYAGFFFTETACEAHLRANPHHYNSTAHSYAISAYHNFELREVMQYLCGKDLR